jgi:cytochrome c
MRWPHAMGWACAFTVATSLALARVHPSGDAGLYAGRGTVRPIPETSAIPTDVRRMLEAKCADCHSSVTKAPFYGRFAPISWLLERDIMEARRHLNFSEWDKYTPEQQVLLKAQMVQQARSGKMPVLQYRVVHWDSALTPTELRMLVEWAHRTAGPDSDAPMMEAGDAARGEVVFERRCTGCHALTTDREGPRLKDVYGRPTATVSGFPYSAALRGAHAVWNKESLDKWLTDPDSFIAGSNMDFRVPKAQERRDLIAFLARSAGR